MKLRMTGEKHLRPTYKMMFFRGEDNKSYVTHVEHSNGNAERWWSLKRGQVILGANILRKNIINADSMISIIGD